MTNKSIRQRVEEFSYFDILNATSKSADDYSARLLRRELYYRENLVIFWINPLMFEL
jgi:hypothetical protein